MGNIDFSEMTKEDAENMMLMLPHNYDYIGILEPLKDAFYREDEWHDYIHKGFFTIYDKVVDLGYCPYCFEELVEEVEYNNHGERGHPMIEKYVTYHCANGCIWKEIYD